MEGTTVLYTDERREKHNAILNKVWQQDETGPSYVNLVYVTKDASKHDQYGLQIERATSVPRKSDANIAGRHFELI